MTRNTITKKLANKIVAGTQAKADVWLPLKLLELTTTQWLLLTRLSAMNDQRPTDLASTIGVEVPLITMSARPLISSGYINCSAMSRDRREKHLHITPAGEALLCEIERALTARGVS